MQLTPSWPARSRSWLSVGYPGEGADALPTHGLTLLELEHGHPGGHWLTAVVPVVLELTAAGHAVFFVESGGYKSYVSGEVLTSACGEQPLLRVHQDADLVVRTPPMNLPDCTLASPLKTSLHGEHLYSCFIPTLTNITADLQQHEDAHLASVVIFDLVEMMRPYFDATDREGYCPIQLSVAEADGGGPPTCWGSQKSEPRQPWRS